MFVVRVGHLYAAVICKRISLVLPSVKKPREWQQRRYANKVAAYYRKYHGLDAVVEEV